MVDMTFSDTKPIINAPSPPDQVILPGNLTVPTETPVPVPAAAIDLPTASDE